MDQSDRSSIFQATVDCMVSSLVELLQQPVHPLGACRPCIQLGPLGLVVPRPS